MNPRLLDDDDDEDDDDKKEGKTLITDPLAGKMLKTRTVLISGTIDKELAEKTSANCFFWKIWATSQLEFLSIPPAETRTRVMRYLTCFVLYTPIFGLLAWGL